jgi:hypothetical protein
LTLLGKSGHYLFSFNQNSPFYPGYLFKGSISSAFVQLPANHSSESSRIRVAALVRRAYSP